MLKKINTASLVLVIAALGVATAASIARASALTQEPVYDKFIYLPMLAKPPSSLCRMGLAALPDNAGYNRSLSEFKVGALVNWSPSPARTLPGDVTFLHVISVKDPVQGLWSDKTAAAAAASLVTANPGGYWQIGNEPDTCYYSQNGNRQDCVTSFEYGHRYRVIAQAIRQADPKARVAFGSIVQPTPLRLRYLELAFNQLASELDGVDEATALIDFWSIHGFILNEINGEWGTGVPKDYNEFLYPGVSPVRITDFSNTYSISIFAQRVRDFRAWMAQKGQQNKALWITEYGSLFPPIDPPGGPNLVNVSDQATAAYMLSSFDFLRFTSDPSTGMPQDDHRLVQRWFWYSLNDYRYNFGGSIVDPSNNAAITSIGQSWLGYVNALTPDASCLP